MPACCLSILVKLFQELFSLVKHYPYFFYFPVNFFQFPQRFLSLLVKLFNACGLVNNASPFPRAHLDNSRNVSLHYDVVSCWLDSNLVQKARDFIQSASFLLQAANAFSLPVNAPADFKLLPLVIFQSQAYPCCFILCLMVYELCNPVSP